jgi:2-polyprenyl-6-hydroxyphenyl methylase/3-demethylubiquinone-9 3-methyltransferase
VKFISALIVLHRAYRRFPSGARMHVLIRFLTCPFLRVARHIPPGARVLDVGAGHGILSVLARERGADPIAVDPDVRKVRRIAGVHSAVGFDDCIRGRFDVVAIVDVLYKIPIAEWDALLAHIAERLGPNGVLLIKEHDPTSRIKHGWNRLQEWIASRLNLTLGESFNYETPAEFVARLQRHGLSDVQLVPLSRGYPHPHVLYVARALSSDRLN